MWLFWPSLSHCWSKSIQGLIVYWILSKPSCQQDAIALNIQDSGASFKNFLLKMAEYFQGSGSWESKKSWGKWLLHVFCKVQRINSPVLKNSSPMSQSWKYDWERTWENTLPEKLGNKHALCSELVELLQSRGVIDDHRGGVSSGLA